MPEVAYLAHTLRSDWNNGNAHFLRGLLRALGSVGHQVTAWEPEHEWSIDNLVVEPSGQQSLHQFTATYPDLNLNTYPESPSSPDAIDLWQERLSSTHVVILHEWNPPALAHLLLTLRDRLHFKLLFHDTHHRASSSPDSFLSLGLHRFDGILAFGEALRHLYLHRFHLTHVWTVHEAADTAVFHPIRGERLQQDLVWIGNWGEDERAQEIRHFLIEPAATLGPLTRTRVFGVRYPQQGLDALAKAGIAYGGYLPNLQAPAVYAQSRLTLHIPRQQYSAVMTGIPTIRVFEALACGIPLISAPWQDSEHLFRPGDLCFASSGTAMLEAMKHLLANPRAATDQAARGLETVLARHTCLHRAQQLTAIFQELLS